MATESQFREVVGTLLSRTKLGENSPWSRIPTARVQQLIRNPLQLAETFVQFIANDGKLIVGELRALKIDRSTEFDPAKFIGSGWSLWRGSIDGNGLEGAERKDARSLALTEIDLGKLRFECCLKDEELEITGEEQLVRLKADEASLIRADARIAQALFEEPGQETLEWIRANTGKDSFGFPGSELRCRDGSRCVLTLYVSRGKWGWDYYKLTEVGRASLVFSVS